MTEIKKVNTDAEKIKEFFMSGIDCGQVVVSYFADRFGLDVKTARKIAAGFGAGMFNSEKCGSVLGAYVVLGLKYGHCEPNDADQKGIMISKMKEFDSKFKEFSESDICQEMLGYDLRIDEQRDEAIAKGLLFDFCPRAVLKSITILEEML